MAELSGLMRGKRGLVMGVANHRSLGWGIAKACRAHGAELAFTYQGEALKKRVEPLAQEAGGIVVGDCDVTVPSSIDAAFAVLQSAWGAIDFLVHAIAFSDKDQLDGRYIDTTADNFTKTMLVSCYSFTAIAQRAEKIMPNGGAMLTLTYYGAEKWMPHTTSWALAKSALEASVRYLAADLGVKNIASTPSRPGRSRRSPLPASPTSATSSNGTSTTRRCGATSLSRTSARRARICFPTCRAASPARCITSMPAITSSA